MSSTNRRLRRAALRHAATDQARRLGCACNLEIRVLASEGRYHRLDVAHDRECWMAEARVTTLELLDQRTTARCER